MIVVLEGGEAIADNDGCSRYVRSSVKESEFLESLQPIGCGHFDSDVVGMSSPTYCYRMCQPGWLGVVAFYKTILFLTKACACAAFNRQWPKMNRCAALSDFE